MALNIIRNGRFESGALSPGWRQTPGSATLDGGVTNTTSYSGRSCLELRGLDFVEQVFSFAKATGDLTLYAKVESEVRSGPIYLRIEYFGGEENVHFLRPSESWTEFTFEVDHSLYLRKIQFATGETGPVYFDNVSLRGSRANPYAIYRHWLERSSPSFPWVPRPFYQEFPALPGGMMGEEMMFENLMAMEDRLTKIEDQLTKLSSVFSMKENLVEG